MTHAPRFFRRFLPLLAAALLAGCGNLAYYSHLAGGEYELLSRREPIARIVEDQRRDPALRVRLRKVLDARAFAAQRLGLPDNGSYTQYADLGRPYVVWNVFATPELSLAPVEHCFLFVGCVAYRGYFTPERANAQAAELKAEGYEVYVAGVPAYSTLGTFDDPVINTMMNWSDGYLIATVFHELAHQQLFVRGDTAFDESYASFVGEQGLREYLAARGLDDAGERLRLQRERLFRSRVSDTRERLQALYESDLPAEEKRRRKAKEFERLRAGYRELRAGAWKDFAGYDRWFQGEINNAKLAPLRLYDQWVPAFDALYRQHPGDWAAFHAAAAAIAALPEEQRHFQLRELAARGPAAAAGKD